MRVVEPGGWKSCGPGDRIAELAGAMRPGGSGGRGGVGADVERRCSRADWIDPNLARVFDVGNETYIPPDLFGDLLLDRA